MIDLVDFLAFLLVEGKVLEHQKGELIKNLILICSSILRAVAVIIDLKVDVPYPDISNLIFSFIKPKFSSEY